MFQLLFRNHIEFWRLSVEKGVVELLERRIPTFAKSQRRVADYIIKEPVQSAFYTIEELARVSNVSTATVVRLAQSMGYENYRNFQKDLQQYVQAKASPLEKIMLADIKTDTLAGENREEHSSLEETSSVVIENIQKTISGLSEETVGTIVDRLLAARHIYVTGQRGTEHFAVYLAYHLDRMLAKVDFLPSESTRLPEIFQRVNEQDLFLVSTVYRYSAAATKVAQIAKLRGATTIAISDSYDSPLAPYSDYQMVTYCKTNDFHNSGAAMICLADVLIDACYHKAKGDVRKLLQDTEAYILDLKMKVE